MLHTREQRPPSGSAGAFLPKYVASLTAPFGGGTGHVLFGLHLGVSGLTCAGVVLDRARISNIDLANSEEQRPFCWMIGQDLTIEIHMRPAYDA